MQQRTVDLEGVLQSTGAGGAGRTTRPCPGGRPGAPPCRQGGDELQAAAALVGVGHPPQPRKWCRRVLHGDRDDLVEQQDRELDRAGSVPESVGHHLADEQLGQVGQRLQAPLGEPRHCPRASGAYRLDAARELPARDPLRLEAGDLGHDQRHVVVVTGVPTGGGQQLVAQRLERDGFPAEAGGEQREPVVEVDLPGLDQSVGVEQQPGAVGHRHRDALEGDAAHPQRRTGRLRQQPGRPVRLAEDRRRMTGRGEGQLSRDRVVDGVHAGRELDLVGALREVVEMAEHVLREVVEHRQGADGGPQLPHRRGRAQAAAHDVADHEGRPPARQRDDVEPVAPDAHLAAAGEVALCRVDPGDLRLGRGEQGPLERDRRRPRLVVEADVVQRHRGPAGDLLGEGDVGRGVARRAGAAAQPDDAQHPAAGEERREDLRAVLGGPVAGLGAPGGEGDRGSAPRRVAHPLVLGVDCGVAGGARGGHPAQDGGARVRRHVRVEESLDEVDLDLLGQPRHDDVREPAGDGPQVEGVRQVRAGVGQQGQPALRRELPDRCPVHGPILTHAGTPDQPRRPPPPVGAGGAVGPHPSR